MVLGNWMCSCRRITLYLYLSSWATFRSKWTKVLTLNPKILKPLEENIGSSLHDVVVGKGILNKTPFALELRPTFNNWEFIKLKCFWRTAKATVSWVKKKPTEWQESCQLYTWQGMNIQNIQRIHKKSQANKWCNQIWCSDLKRILNQRNRNG